MQFLEALTNDQYIRYILEDNKSIVAKTHRNAYFREVIGFGEQYYCLSRNSARRGLEAALANTYLDLKMNRINLSEVNLHMETFLRAKRQFFILKRNEMQTAKAKKIRDDEMMRFLIGDE